MLKQWIAFLWLMIITMSLEAHVSPIICSDETTDSWFLIQPVNNDDILFASQTSEETINGTPVECTDLSSEKDEGRKTESIPLSKTREGPSPKVAPENMDMRLRKSLYGCFFLEGGPPLNQNQNGSQHRLLLQDRTIIPIKTRKVMGIRYKPKPDLTGNSTLSCPQTTVTKLREQNIVSAIPYPSSLEYP